MSSLLQACTRRCLINNWRGRRGRYSSSFSVGDKLHGYTIQNVTDCPDFNLQAIQLIHDNTAAQHLHINREDTNNVFGVSFRTTPMDSTGVSHILEHTTLCGSQHYPVRDPFFKMLTRSMATFMNAYTANDWTLYPFSTQNSSDYSNLMSVYLDCVFYPNLRQLDFHQEGWRLEHEEPHDKSSPLVFKGVVFNEMKGMFSNSEFLYDTSLQSLLLPSHTYSHVSGGDPLSILDLSWESLKQFHSTHYHPSNGRFYTYGTFPLDSHLQYINSTVLSHFTVTPPSTEVPYEPRWSQPRQHYISCAPDPMATDTSKQTTVGVAYICGNSVDPYESLVNDILSKLLIDGPPSPFYQSLLDSNLGNDYSPSTGMNSYTKDNYFSVGLQGIATDDVDKVTNIIDQTFQKVAEEGFSEQRIKAVLHQTEVALKHQTSNFGLGLLLSIITPWTHNGDLPSLLSINNHIEAFKERLSSDPQYLQKRVEECFINNNHKLTLIMSPDDNYSARRREEEDRKLSSLVTSLSVADKETVYNNGILLLEDQNRTDSNECLPSLSVNDVERTTPTSELTHEDHECTPIQYCIQPTNGITYMRLLSSVSELPNELRPYLPIFCSVITKLGTHDMDYRQLAQQVDLYTGSGLMVGTHVSPHHTEGHQLEQRYSQCLFFTNNIKIHRKPSFLCLSFSSHCLDRHLPYMLSLWEDVFNKPHLQDADRLRTLVTMAASSLSLTIASNGHSYAMIGSGAGLNYRGELNEQYNGITHLKFLKELSELTDLTPLIQKLTSIAVHVLDTGCMRCSFNMTEDQFPVTSTAVEGFLDNLPGSSTDTPLFMEQYPSDHYPTSSSSLHYQLPFSVYYTGQSFNTVPYSHIDSPVLRVLAQLMGWKYLHKEIREKGGAYGGGARYSEGMFHFYSYRDPNSIETIDKFNSSIEWAVGGAFTLQDVEECKLSVLSQVDSPVSPANKGSSYFLKGLTDDLKQQYRERLFDVNKEDLIRVANRYLKEAQCKGSVIIGPEINNLPSEWTVNSLSL